MFTTKWGLGIKKLFMANKINENGYMRVQVPIIWGKEVFETSGHWQHYKENLFIINIDGREFGIKPILNANEILKLQKFVKTIYCNEKVEDYILHLVEATRNPNKYKLNFGRFIESGCSPRASIALYIASKAEALL